MFSKPAHSLQVQALLAEGLKQAIKKPELKDLTPEQFEKNTTTRMAKFQSPSHEDLVKNTTYTSTLETKTNNPLMIGSGPIMDSYKGLHESLRKENKEHTWPESYYPELTGAAYDRNGNIAFLYAGMAKGMTFELITPIDLLLKRAANEFYQGDLGGAFVELVWLLRNNYTLEVDKDGKILAKPGKSESKPELPTMTQKFFKAEEAIKEMEKIQLIWNKFSEEEVNRVRNRWATDLCANQNFVSEKSKGKPEFKAHLAEATTILDASRKLTASM